jgi:hypothetical protein
MGISSRLHPIYIRPTSTPVFSNERITPGFRYDDNPDHSPGYSDIFVSNTGSIYLHHWANDNLHALLKESRGTSIAPGDL